MVSVLRGRLQLCHALGPPSAAPRRAGLVEAASWRRTGEKENKIHTVYCPSAPPLLLLCVTNLKCPAGTNYSILMSAVSSNCIWRACYLLIHMLTTTTSSQITFPSDEDACLVLARALPAESPGTGAHKMAMAILLFAECKGLPAKPARK